MGESYYSDGRQVKADPDPAIRRQGAAYLSLLRKDPPGQSTANRLGQANHFNGVVSIAIKARMDLMGSCSFQVLKKRKASKGKATFGPRGTVAKSIGGTQHQGRDEDYTPVDDLDFPLARMMSRPNPNETQGELAAKLVLQNCLTGVGPLWAVPNAMGKPVELWSLKTPLINPIWQWSQQYPNGAWRVNPYTPGGWSGSLPYGMGATGAIIPGEEVKRFLEPHPLIDWDGYSPLTAGAVELDVLRSIDESRKSAMDNGLQLDAVLVAPGMDEGGLQRFVDNMTERHGGSKNARKFGAIAPPAGLTDKATLQTFGASAKDMDYSQGWEQYVKFALALFGVPASVAGLATTTSYSELYAALRQFHHRQSQYIGRFESWYTKVLAWPWCSFTDEYLVRIKLPALDDPDLREKQFTRQLSNDLITYNEARAKDDLDPVEGGDVPVSIYVETLKAKLAPKPEPQPQPEPPPASKSVDGGPLAGAVPTPDNAAAEGTGFDLVMKANPPPRSGLVWKEETHRWIRPEEANVSKPNKAAADVSAALGKGAAAGISEGFFDGLEKSLAETGQVPSAERSAKSKVAQAWNMVQSMGLHKIKDAAQRFVAATRDAYAGGNTQKSWTDALNKNFADVQSSQPQPSNPSPPSQPSQPVHENKPTGDTDALIERGKKWAESQAERHTDALAKHFGITNSSARYLLKDTISRAMEKAAKDGSATLVLKGRDGKVLRVTVKRRENITKSVDSDNWDVSVEHGRLAIGDEKGEQFSAESADAFEQATVKKANDAASTIVNTDGGFLVGDRRAARRKARRIVRRALRSVEGC